MPAPDGFLAPPSSPSGSPSGSPSEAARCGDVVPAWLRSRPPQASLAAPELARALLGMVRTSNQGKRLEGAADELVGKVKAGIGGVIGNEQMQAV